MGTDETRMGSLVDPFLNPSDPCLSVADSEILHRKISHGQTRTVTGQKLRVCPRQISTPHLAKCVVLRTLALPAGFCANVRSPVSPDEKFPIALLLSAGRKPHWGRGTI